MNPLSWLGIARLGLVQAALGAVVVLATSTLNRVMVVEWSWPAIVPGLLVALHYAVQVLRPVAGHRSDGGPQRTPWIVGGMVLLVTSGIGSAGAVGLMGTHRLAGLAAATVAYAGIGLGVGVAGTSLLVLLASRTAPERRPAAAMTAWIMMIAGFAVTAGVASKFLDPFSPTRLLAVSAGVSAAALLLTAVGVWRVEGEAVAATAVPLARASFGVALREVWAEPVARRFAVFVFVSMLAYSGQELVLEPFAGAVFGLTPGGTAALTGLQHGGALIGMLLVGVCCRRPEWLRAATVAGCAGSTLALLALAASAWIGTALPLRGVVAALGFANGAFAVGGLAATLGSDLGRAAFGAARASYALVFAAEAILFLVAARQALHLFHGDRGTALAGRLVAGA